VSAFPEGKPARRQMQMTGTRVMIYIRIAKVLHNLQACISKRFTVN